MTSKTKTEIKKVKLPATIELSISKIIDINVACAKVQNSHGLKGKLAFDLGELADRSEDIYVRAEKEKSRIIEEVRKSNPSEKDQVSELERQLTEFLESKVEIVIPAIKLSQLIADRDMLAYNIKEGDSLVPPVFIKVMREWIENDIQL